MTYYYRCSECGAVMAFLEQSDGHSKYQCVNCLRLEIIQDVSDAAIA